MEEGAEATFVSLKVAGQRLTIISTIVDMRNRSLVGQ